MKKKLDGCSHGSAALSYVNELTQLAGRTLIPPACKTHRRLTAANKNAAVMVHTCPLTEMFVCLVACTCRKVCYSALDPCANCAQGRIPCKCT